jgi:hypothetical protein
MVVVMVSDRQRDRPREPVSEGCVFCHTKVSDPDPSHPIEAWGCHSCHLGNKYAFEKDRAHVAMVRNPGDLRVVHRTCGQVNCHPDIVHRVKNSVMATNEGILNTIQYHWLNIQSAGTTVEDLMDKSPPDNLAISHFRKMCGGCHLWKERGDRPGEIGFRGGGCTGGHGLDKEPDEMRVPGPWDHPVVTTRIPSDNCVKCHNRSARIGLSYLGKFESAGYGTPHERGGLNGRRLSGNRFFIHLQPDVHFSRAGLECIDCHTAVGLMGDGKRYDRMADQVDITCEACHLPSFSEQEDPDDLANRLAVLNQNIPRPLGASVAVTRNGTPIYNLQKRGKEIVFFRKRDGRPLTLGKPFSQGRYHTLTGHERLSCQACHSKWVPQCYGCHLDYQGSAYQRDWINGRVTAGRWQERRSYMRFATPALGVSPEDRIYPITPCQVFVDLWAPGSSDRPSGSFRVFTLSALDPHTTDDGSRNCLECHGDPKALGLGEGILHRQNSKWAFRPTYDGSASGLGIDFPLDGYVDLAGQRLQEPSRNGARPLGAEELEKILWVGVCLGCHDRYEDPIYEAFSDAKRRFVSDAHIPCKR